MCLRRTRCATGNPLCPTNPAQPATVVTSGNRVGKIPPGERANGLQIENQMSGTVITAAAEPLLTTAPMAMDVNQLIAR